MLREHEGSYGCDMSVQVHPRPSVSFDADICDCSFVYCSNYDDLAEELQATNGLSYEDEQTCEM